MPEVLTIPAEFSEIQPAVTQCRFALTHRGKLLNLLIKLRLVVEGHRLPPQCLANRLWRTKFRRTVVLFRAAKFLLCSVVQAWNALQRHEQRKRHGELFRRRVWM